MVGRALLALLALALVGCSDDDGAASGSGSGSGTAPTSGPVRGDGRDARMPFVEDEYSGEDGPTVVIIGDSIVDGTRVELHRALAGGFQVAIAGAIGEGYAGGLRSDDLGFDVLAAITDLYAAMEPDIVVLALGTNDAWKPELAVVDSLPRLQSIAETFDGSCIVGVEVYEDAVPEGFSHTEAVTINDTLDGVADEIVDISELAATAFEPDHVHPLPDAFDDYAALVADGVDRCTD